MSPLYMDIPPAHAPIGDNIRHFEEAAEDDVMRARRRYLEIMLPNCRSPRMRMLHAAAASGMDGADFKLLFLTSMHGDGDGRNIKIGNEQLGLLMGYTRQWTGKLLKDLENDGWFEKKKSQRAPRVATIPPHVMQPLLTEILERSMAERKPLVVDPAILPHAVAPFQVPECQPMSLHSDECKAQSYRSPSAESVSLHSASHPENASVNPRPRECQLSLSQNQYEPVKRKEDTRARSLVYQEGNAIVGPGFRFDQGMIETNGLMAGFSPEKSLIVAELIAWDWVSTGFKPQAVGPQFRQAIANRRVHFAVADSKLKQELEALKASPPASRQQQSTRQGNGSAPMRSSGGPNDAIIAEIKAKYPEKFAHLNKAGA